MIESKDSRRLEFGVYGLSQADEQEENEESMDSVPDTVLGAMLLFRSAFIVFVE